MIGMQGCIKLPIPPFAFAGGECFQVVWDWGRKSSGEEGNGREEERREEGRREGGRREEGRREGGRREF